MLAKNSIKDNCTGCGACYMSCSQNCISMREDEKGFLYPVIDSEKCIDCGVCATVCEKTLEVHKQQQAVAYGMYCLNQEIVERSSSGGIYSMLALSILQEGGIVYGVAMDDDCKGASHIAITREEDLPRTMGSKYLQSRLGESFSQIKKELEDGKTVMFTGTPCQVDGLKAYLDREYENLLCVQLVCHGVPSPKLWRKYIEEQSKAITDVKFRNKKYGWELFDLQLTDSIGNRINQVKDENSYMRLFLGNYSLRPSCYECGHKKKENAADIILGDFWKVYNICQEIYNRKGSSLVIVNSVKGKEAIDKITSNDTRSRVVGKEVEYNIAVASNSAILNSVKKPSDYEEFWKQVDNCSTIDLCRRYNPLGKKERIIIGLRKLKRSFER